MYLYQCTKCELAWLSSKPGKHCPYCTSIFVTEKDMVEEFPELKKYTCACQAKTEYLASETLVCCGVCGKEAQEEDSMELSFTSNVLDFKPFKVPSKVETSSKKVFLVSKKVQPSRLERIEKQLEYGLYQCKSFLCGKYWASDAKHKSSRCAFCGSNFIELAEGELKNRDTPEQACLECGCLIRYDFELKAPEYCPSCGLNNLSRHYEHIKQSILGLVRARKAKSLVDEDLISICRIDFRQAFKEKMPSDKDFKGSWLHRRHVIPQHLLRSAWNAAVKTNSPNSHGLSVLFEKLGGSGKFNTDKQLANAILFTINENPKNLFLAEGTPNSAIGALAHSLMDLVQKYRDSNSNLSQSQQVEALIEEFMEIRSPPKWGVAVGKMVEGIIKTYAVVLGDAESLQEALGFVEDLADTANLDLDTTKQGLGNQNLKALALYKKFLAWELNPGNWGAFIDLLVEFMSTDMVS